MYVCLMLKIHRHRSIFSAISCLIKKSTYVTWLQNIKSLYSCNVTAKAVVNFGWSRATPSDFSSGREVEEDEARTIRQGNIHFYNSFFSFPALATANPSLDGDISEF